MFLEEKGVSEIPQITSFETVVKKQVIFLFLV